MKIYMMIVLGAATALSGCSSLSKIADAEAYQHIAAAEELERSGDFRKAEEQYLMVAEQLPHTAPYPQALRGLALLSLSPANPSHNDSAGITWLRSYLPHAPSGIERENTLLQLRLLERAMSLEAEVADNAAMSGSNMQRADSLSHELSLRTKRLQQVETELKQVSSELKRLRDVDVQLHRRKK
ncbi:MAG: hypothetical protein ACKVRP_05750 [Bacteroidota bacterium]